MTARTESGPRRWLDRLPRRRAVDDESAHLVPGWRVIAAKELTDHVTSIRFLVLLVILAIAAAIPLYFAAGRLRDLAEQVSGAQALFLGLFTLGSQEFDFLRADTFVAWLAPLLGIAFGFDAINVERTEGTLPRLVSQPIHRDDVINGKFAAGLGVIAVTLLGMVMIVAGVGMLRLGIVPDMTELVRIVTWLLVTILYVGFWLAFAVLLSVVLRRAASAALIGFGTWVAVVFFGPLLIGLLANIIAPAPGAIQTQEDFEQDLRAAQTRQLITRLSPHTLYVEAASVILNPLDPVTAAANGQGTFSPATIDEWIQANDERRLGSHLKIEQSLLLVWPHIVGLAALTTVVFAGAYVIFMRQEVRA